MLRGKDKLTPFGYGVKRVVRLWDHQARLEKSVGNFYSVLNCAGICRLCIYNFVRAFHLTQTYNDEG
jgi:hypothetical protein